MKHLFLLQPEHLFKYEELNKIVIQNNKLFNDLLFKVPGGNSDSRAKNLLKARFIHESDENYPKNALLMYTKSQPAVKRNKAVINSLPGELYTIETNIKIPGNCKYTLVLLEA